MKFTIGYIDHNDDVYNKYLGPSLLNLSGDFDVIKTSSLECSFFLCCCLFNKPNEMITNWTNEE